MLRILQDELCTVSELFDKFLFMLFWALATAAISFFTRI